MKHLTLSLILCFYLVGSAKSQDNPAQHKTTTKQKLVIGGLAVQQIASFAVQYKWWWKNDYKAFQFENDHFIDNYALGVDKAGHFYTSYLYFHSLNEIMKWADFSPKARRITSVVLPLAWAISIEIGDGFSSYGYSWEDLASNSLGIGYGFLQERFPYMRNFKFKMSYYPSSYFIDSGFKNWSLTEDYRRHCYWLSFDIHNLLPTKAQRFLPNFLNMAIGYGIDPNTPRWGTPNLRDLCIAFDWNLSSIKTKRKGAYALKELADYIHYPAPGIGKVQGEPSRFIILR